MGMKVIPSGSSVIVTEKNDRGDHHDRGHDQHAEILHEQAASFRDAIASRERYDVAAATRHTDTVTGIKDARYDIVNAIDRTAVASSLAGCKTDDCVTSGFARTNEGLQEGLCTVKEAVGAGFAAAQRDLCDVAKDVNKGICHLSERSSDSFGIASVQAEKNAFGLQVQGDKNTAALQVQSDKNAAALGLQATTLAGEASVQAQNFSNLASVQAERIRTELGMLTATGFQVASTQAERIAAASSLEATKFADAAFLRAEQIANAAARQAAECCCELKEKMASQESDRLRIELADVKLDAKLARMCDDRFVRGGPRG